MRKINHNGRNKHDRYVALPHVWLEHDAWKDMSVHARLLFIEIRRRFNGQNNGEISLSYREAVEVLHCSKGSCKQYFDELIIHGFLKAAIRGRYQNRHASTWAMTTEGWNGAAPTNDWRRFEKKNLSSATGTHSTPH